MVRNKANFWWGSKAVVFTNSTSGGKTHECLCTAFLPKFKTDVEKNAREQLRFQLHQQLGSVAYVEAPLLRQALLSAQKSVKSDEALTPVLYQELEKSVRQLSECYKKIVL